MKILSKEQRLKLFFERLSEAPVATSAEEAFQLLAETLNRIEDAHSGVPFDPSNWQSDGRLYPPQEDSKRSVDGRENLHRYRSRGHNTFISSDGAILILDLSKNVIFEKSGRNGESITFGEQDL